MAIQEVIEIKKVNKQSKKKIVRKTSSNKNTGKSIGSQQSLQPGGRGELTSSGIPGQRNTGPTSGRTS